ncbi:shikimate kinase [Daejeonella oryzae]|uniref:shikimate kinase n=1 Tax=Daejeonella oryzae TaxID=1122943 RepID=UPI00047C14A2|nr:shikimate kinase [Daejeonella oryzae]
MKIFLVGFMGSGKSSLGRKLARQLGLEFFDSDKLVEQKTGLKVADYFQLYGEESFREIERDILQKSWYPDNCVIATGGGAPCYFDNMEWMNQNGKVIYLSLSAKTLADRLENSKTERPLIKDLKGQELIDFISGKLSEREIYYNKAAFIISGIDLTAEKLAGYLSHVNENQER